MSNSIKKLNFKLVNKSEIARLYKETYKEDISAAYVHMLLDPTNRRKNKEKLRRLSLIIRSQLNAA